MNDVDLAKVRRRLAGAMVAINELAEMTGSPRVKQDSEKWVQKRAEVSREMTGAQQALGLNAIEAI
jgi:hypothetical protein